MILRVIGRMASVAIGFAAGLITAGATLLLLAGERWAAASAPRGDGGAGLFDAAAEVIRFAAFAASFAPALTLLSPLLVVIVGEVLRIRSALYYMAASGLVAASLPMAAAPADGGAGTQLIPHSQHMAILATAGFAAGLSYWLIAGRKA